MQVRRQFLCTNKPTILLTPIKSKELKSATSVTKFLGLRNKNALSRKVLAHTFSGHYLFILQLMLMYQIQEVKRLHKMTIVKVLLSKTEDVVKILKDNDVQIVYSMAKVEPFDKGKSRLKSHFKQCRKFYILNHIVRECTKKRKVSNTSVYYVESRKAWYKLTINEMRQPTNYSYTDAAKDSKYQMEMKARMDLRN
ncbi:hypothetical protein RFI_25136 [Reticulomyxa filosa]|uniref:Uncharacterized protein n=1 Tax=Reticulomyxa filosa TaxID=46433 RepID=X6MGR4_RETFI|nr:hypothetical protein RFI_25136 [Reticulomyxa filosa]|eukprot:ETO12240.1 hypothetical protein RFI_25136 [Reticulomyxa filosa]